MDTTITKPYRTLFLSDFTFAPEVMPFTDPEIISLDEELTTFEQSYLNPDVEKTLISKNELLASYAISKAENSELTLREAENVYYELINNPDYDFITAKLNAGKDLTQNDHDKLEFFNIAKTFRLVNQQNLSVGDIVPEFIQKVHYQLTQGMDVFKRFLVDFDVYKSGMYRCSDEIRVGTYIPSPASQIESGVKELTHWIQTNQTPTSIALFHTALYALHPFNNGNKRVCRILEHILLRAIGINQKNLYSTSYYAHIEKDRYYKNLLNSLERHNFNHFVSFSQEALVMSMISVIKTSIEVKRTSYLNTLKLADNLRRIAKPLIKRRELQFKQLIKVSGKKMARQTFVDSLAKATEAKALVRREEGRNSFYSIPVTIPELSTYDNWVTSARKKLSYIPDDLSLL